MISEQERERIAQEEEIRVRARRRAEVWIEARLVLIGLAIIIFGFAAIAWLYSRQ